MESIITKCEIDFCEQAKMNLGLKLIILIRNGRKKEKTEEAKSK